MAHESPLKNNTQLNSKFGFSVTHFISNFIPPLNFPYTEILTLTNICSLFQKYPAILNILGTCCWALIQFGNKSIRTIYSHVELLSFQGDTIAWALLIYCHAIVSIMCLCIFHRSESPWRIGLVLCHINRCRLYHLFLYINPLWHYVGGLPSRRFLCLFWRKTRQRVSLYWNIP